LGDPKAVSLLVPYSTNPDWQVRYRVVQALTRLGSDEAKSVLATLANDEVEAISNEAKKALELV
jgi:HEAT repeat protein